MSENQSTEQNNEVPAGRNEKLEEGAIIGGNFQIERLIGWGGLGPMYRAIDKAEKRPVALRVFSKNLTVHPEIVEKLKTVVQQTAAIEHKNVLQVYGTGEEEGLFFMLQEYLDGQPMRKLLEKKARAKKTFTLKGAFNVIAHLSNGLNQFEGLFYHGALHPGNILVSRSGRIKIADVGFVQALKSIGDVQPYLAGEEGRYLAPEIIADPESGDARSDVYSMGVLLGELLTGLSPQEGFKKPSEVVSGLPVAIDTVVERCRNADPNDRYLAPNDMKEAMLDVIQTMTESDRTSSQNMQAVSVGGVSASNVASSQAQTSTEGGGQDDSLGIEIDVVTEPGAGGPPPTPPVPGGTFGPPAVVNTQPGIGGIPAKGGDPFPSMTSGEFDLASLVDETASEDEEKFLIQQGKLDFGPFSLRELKVQIRIGEVTGKDMVVDNVTGNRVKVKDHPDLGKYFRGVQRHKELQRRAATQSATQDSEKRKKKVFWGVGAGAFGVVALVVGGILLYKGATKEETGPSRRDQKEMQYETSWDGEEDEGKKGASGKRRRRRRRKGGWKGGKWSDRQELDLGSGGGGGGETLSRHQIYSVMSRYNSKIGNCLVNNGKSGVTIKLQIAGSGKLTAVRTTVSGAADSCIKRAVRGAKFPKFSGARTTGSYSLRVSN